MVVLTRFMQKYRYDVNDKLSQDDKLVACKALFFHPRRDEKIGIGLYEIKVELL